MLQISRDCQELEPFIGEQLASLLYLEPDSELTVGQCFSYLLVMLLALPFACFLLVGMSAKTITSTNVSLWDTHALF
jgi:hypothetical protein